MPTLQTSMYTMPTLLNTICAPTKQFLSCKALCVLLKHNAHLGNTTDVRLIKRSSHVAKHFFRLRLPYLAVESSGRRPDKLCTNLLHLLPSCARAWVSANGFYVHSSALSVHRFLSPPLFLFPSTVPCPFLCTVCPSFPLSASLSLPLHSSLETGLCEATRSCDVTELYAFPVFHCCEVFTRADVVFGRTSHLFIRSHGPCR